MAYTPSDECMAAARTAARNMLNDDELRQAFDRANDVTEKVTKQGFFDGYKDRVNQKILEDAEKARIAAALQKQHTEIKIVLKDKLKTRIKDMVSDGASLKQAVLAIMEGSQKGFSEGRVSIDTVKLSYLDKLITHPLGELEREVPGIRDLHDDPAFDEDLTREWYQISSGGKVGITGNKDAVKAAKILAKYSEFGRQRANKAAPGAIGKLDTYSGAQTHNDMAMLRAGKDAWITAILPRLDIARTFPEAQSEAEIVHILGEVFDTIVTGRDGIIKPDTGRVGPASLAKSLGKTRSLHFKDADAWIDYRKEFGYGSTFDGFMNGQMRMARSIAQMEILGPNPAHMLQSLLDDIAHDIRTDPKIPSDQKKLLIEQANAKLYEDALNTASGVSGRPLTSREATIAAYGESARAVKRMAIQGGSAVLAMPTDAVTAAVASMMRGGSFFHALTTHIVDMAKAIDPQFKRQYLMMYGEGMKGLIDHVGVRYAEANDAIPGKVSKMQNFFFKWTGLSGVTDMGKAIHNKLLTIEMADNIKSDWAGLHPAYRFNLEQSGIHEAEWKAIRAIGSQDIDGTKFLTPEMAGRLKDADIAHLVSGEVGRSNAALAERQAGRQAKTSKEQEWVDKRAFKLEAWMGRMEARLEDRIKTMKGQRDADLAELRQKISDVRDALAPDKRVASDEAPRQMLFRHRPGDVITKKPEENFPNIGDTIRATVGDGIQKEYEVTGYAYSGESPEGTKFFFSLKDKKGDKALRGGSAERGLKYEVIKKASSATEIAAPEDLAGRMVTRKPRQTTLAREEGLAKGKTIRDVAAITKKMADLDKQFQKVGKDKAAQLMADYAERQGELKEFTDRMQRYADSREAADVADVAAQPKRIAEIHDEKRFQLEMSIRRFMADQNRYAVLEPDASSRRALQKWNFGLRAGTVAGEITRMILMFKGFPLAFTNQILKRIVVSNYYQGRRLEQAAHIGTMLAGLTAAGYVVGAIKDLINGKTPQVPRDPKEAAITLSQSMLRSGALGLYGDYLVGATNKYGSTLPETLLGPMFQSGDDARMLAQQALGFGSQKFFDELYTNPNSDAKGGGKLAGRSLNFALQNTPGANVFYIRPALDWLFLNSLRDKANPGVLRRQATDLAKAGQSRIWAPTMQQSLR